MKLRNAIAAMALLACCGPAQAFDFLPGYESAPTVAAALERVRAQPPERSRPEPARHVLLYFGMSEFCPPCREARAILASERVRDKWRPNYVVVNIDLYAPTAAEREVIEQVRVSWAPVLVFLDASGKRVAYARQLRSEADALRLDEFVSQRQYALSALGSVSARDYDPGRLRRIAAEAGAVPGTARIDDRPRVGDVTSGPHERLSGDELRRLLAGKRMHKENRDWFLTLELKERNLIEASGRRKDGRGEMQGTGKWYVTRKGKLCVELASRGVDETWCRHVLRAGETYYVAKDLRPGRLAYRFTLR